MDRLCRLQALAIYRPLQLLLRLVGQRLPGLREVASPLRHINVERRLQTQAHRAKSFPMHLSIRLSYASDANTHHFGVRAAVHEALFTVLPKCFSVRLEGDDESWSVIPLLPAGLPLLKNLSIWGTWLRTRSPLRRISLPNLECLDLQDHVADVIPEAWGSDLKIFTVHNNLMHLDTMMDVFWSTTKLEQLTIGDVESDSDSQISAYDSEDDKVHLPEISMVRRSFAESTPNLDVAQEPSTHYVLRHLRAPALKTLTFTNPYSIKDLLVVRDFVTASRPAPLITSLDLEELSTRSICDGLVSLLYHLPLPEYLGLSAKPAEESPAESTLIRF